jgi:deoxyribodipyrimidine photo-lyase
MQLDGIRKTGLFWFTNDLRIDDNPALNKAAAEVDTLICIYCVAPTSTFHDHKAPGKLSPIRQQFLFESLVDLDKALAEQGQPLIIEFKSPADAIPEYITQYNISHIYRSHNAGEYEQKTWNTLRKRYAMIQFNQRDTHTLFDRSELPFAMDKLPDSFSKFRRMVSDIVVRAPLEKPPQLPTSCLIPKKDWQAAWKEYTLYSQLGDDQLFKGGSQAGRQHLQNYFQGKSASTYKETRNGLDEHCNGVNFSTKFSPWLSNGSISARQIICDLHQYESAVDANDSTYWIFFELLWREYFQWYAQSHKANIFKFNGIKNNNPTTSFYAERFQKWCQGNTPYPIVNACMKQLNATGYMSNRGRQLVASCFVHELNLDWRYGAAYMEQQLVDYDVASNWGNWQYLAGVGADPRGHRRFDLDKQTKIYDPKGLFIKRWGGDQHLEELDSRDIVDWPI